MSISSGLLCEDVVADTYGKVLKKQLRYVVYLIRKTPSKKVITVDRTGERNSTFEDFKLDLPKDKSRYGVFDFSYVTDTNEKRSRMMFLYWSPDGASVELKTLYSASKAIVLSALQCPLEVRSIELTDREYLTEKYLIEEVKPRREKLLRDCQPDIEG